MYARSTTMRGDPRRVDEGVAMLRDEIVPTVQEMDGCIGLSLLLDRGAGTSILTSAWDSEDAMRASSQGMEPLRRRGAELLSATPEVREWEIGYSIVTAGDASRAKAVPSYVQLRDSGLVRTPTRGDRFVVPIGHG